MRRDDTTELRASVAPEWEALLVAARAALEGSSVYPHSGQIALCLATTHRHVV